MIFDTENGAPVADLLGRLLAEPRGSEESQWLMINMISSIDGVAVVEGSSTPLGDEDDRELFNALRATADLVLVGAGTIRAENYRPITLPEPAREARASAGLAPEPGLAIVTGRLDLDPEARVFGDQSRRPLIVTHRDADPERVESLRPVADIVQLGSLDGESILRGLGPVHVVLSEGGPTLNRHLFAAGVVDEINLTVAPMVVGGPSKGITHGDPIVPPAKMRLDRIYRGDRSLFLRYLR